MKASKSLMNAQESSVLELPSPFFSLVLLSIAVLFSTLPFLFVRFVPATDLPQHIAQIRLLYDLLPSGNHSLYTITLFSANVLVYWILALLWLVFSPLFTGALFMLLLTLSWILSIFFLARYNFSKKWQKFSRRWQKI